MGQRPQSQKLSKSLLTSALVAISCYGQKLSADNLSADSTASTQDGLMLAGCEASFGNSTSQNDGNGLQTLAARTNLSSSTESEPGATYTGTDTFSIAASCSISLDLDCAAPFKDSSGNCRFIHSSSVGSASYSLVPAGRKIEEGYGVRLTRDATSAHMGPSDAAMVVPASGGSVNEDFRTEYQATLGLDYRDNEEGVYLLDATIIISESL